MDEKWFGSSKTIIFNVATLVVAIGGAIQGLEFMSPKAIAAIGAAVAVANIVLRIVTKAHRSKKKRRCIVLLRKQQREQVREEALRFYVENWGTSEVEAVEPIIRTKFMAILGPILLEIAIKLAIKFIQNWLAKGLSPSMVSPVYVAGEPDYEDDDGEEKTSE